MTQGELSPALFLDRDGIINIDTGFVNKREDFIFQDSIFELCRYFKAKGFKLVVITNQSGIGRGLFTLEDFHQINNWMMNRFEQEGCHLDLVMASTLDPNNTDASTYEKRHRKPLPGMLTSASEVLHLDLEESVLIGDRYSDIQAGHSAGLKKLFLVHPEASHSDEHESFKSIAGCLVRLQELIP